METGAAKPKVEEIKCTASTPRKESDDCNECANKSPCVPCIMEKWRNEDEGDDEEDNNESINVDAIHMNRNSGCKECTNKSECIDCIMKKVRSDDFMDNSV